jgi:hypothetical protein
MKEWGAWLNCFYQKASADQRIGPTHISVYFALLYEAGHLLPLPFYLRRETLMLHAKVYSPVTLNRCLRDLHDYGYIEYLPSFTPGRTMVAVRSEW